jgi:hypothetical protein
MATKQAPARKRKSQKRRKPVATLKAKVTLSKFSRWKNRISRASIADVGMHGILLRAAAVKSWEFASFTHRTPAPANGFYLTATLRGICEDLIVLSFLDTLSAEDRNAAIGLLSQKDLVEAVGAQTAFFKDERPWQPVLAVKSATLDTGEEKLRVLSRSFGWTGRQAWPSVWYMAKATSLTPLYSYLYSATSRWVHFSPQILMRMGWGDSPDKPSDQTKWRFTTKNFSGYYKEFNRVYSAYLFLRLLRGPVRGLHDSKMATLLDSLEGDLSEVIRWPELVTYEEMNLKGPSQVQRLLLWAGYEANADRDSAV